MLLYIHCMAELLISKLVSVVNKHACVAHLSVNWYISLYINYFLFHNNVFTLFTFLLVCVHEHKSKLGHNLPFLNHISIQV